LPSDPSPSAHAWPVEAERTSRLPDYVPLAQPDLLARYKTALRYIAERAPTIDDARRVAAEALEGRVDHTTVEHTTVEHTAEVQPEAPSSEIDNIETGVTDEQLAAVTDYVARTTKRPRQVNIATSSPTTVDKLVEIVRAAGDVGISGVCIPPRRAQPAPAQTARQGFKVPRARSEPFPNAAEIGREIDFSRSMPLLGSPKTSCRHDVSCLN